MGSCNMTIVLGTVLIGLLIAVIVIKHRKQYEKFYNYDEPEQIYYKPATIVAESKPKPFGKILGSLIIAVLLFFFVITITAQPTQNIIS